MHTMIQLRTPRSIRTWRVLAGSDLPMQSGVVYEEARDSISKNGVRPL
jgi:hypothetical protein